MAASITRVVAMSNRNRGDVVNQPGTALAWAIIAITRMPSKLTERVSAAASCWALTRCATTGAL